MCFTMQTKSNYYSLSLKRNRSVHVPVSYVRCSIFVLKQVELIVKFIIISVDFFFFFFLQIVTIYNAKCEHNQRQLITRWFLCLCLSVSLCLSLTVRLCLSACLSLSVFLCLSVTVSLCVSVSLSSSLSWLVFRCVKCHTKL